MIPFKDKDIGTVKVSSFRTCLGVIGNRCSDIVETIGVYIHAYSGSANENTAINFVQGNSLGQFTGIIRIIIIGIKFSRPPINSLISFFLKLANQFLLYFETAMICRDGNFRFFFSEPVFNLFHSLSSLSLYICKYFLMN